MMPNQNTNGFPNKIYIILKKLRLNFFWPPYAIISMRKFHLLFYRAAAADASFFVFYACAFSAFRQAKDDVFLAIDVTRALPANAQFFHFFPNFLLVHFLAPFNLIYNRISNRRRGSSGKFLPRLLHFLREVLLLRHSNHPILFFYLRKSTGMLSLWHTYC